MAASYRCFVEPDPSQGELDSLVDELCVRDAVVDDGGRLQLVEHERYGKVMCEPAQQSVMHGDGVHVARGERRGDAEFDLRDHAQGDPTEEQPGELTVFHEAAEDQTCQDDLIAFCGRLLHTDESDIKLIDDVDQSFGGGRQRRRPLWTGRILIARKVECMAV